MCQLKCTYLIVRIQYQSWIAVQLVQDGVAWNRGPGVCFVNIIGQLLYLFRFLDSLSVGGSICVQLLDMIRQVPPVDCSGRISVASRSILVCYRIVSWSVK